MLGKQSYPATRQGKNKGAGGEGGEEQSLCCPQCSAQCPCWLRDSCKGGCPELVPSWAISHHLSLSPALLWGLLCSEPPPWQGVGTAPGHPSHSVTILFSQRPSTGHCSDHPTASFPACSRQFVPATPRLFEESSESVFEMPHDETA